MDIHAWLGWARLGPTEWEALRLSLAVALIAVACALPVAIAGAWFVARSQAPGRGVVNALLHLPLVLPPIVTGYLLLVLLGVRGPLGRWLFDMLGLRLAFSTKAVVIATAVMVLPVMARTYGSASTPSTGGSKRRPARSGRRAATCSSA